MFLRRTNIVLFVDEGPVLPVQCFVTSFLPVQCEGDFLYESLVVEVGLIDLKILRKNLRC